MGIPLKLLAIEDSASDADLIILKLKKSGYDVICHRVEDGPQMWQALQEQTWDVIISDHNLPHFDSLRALQVLKDSGLDIPFIIVSGAIGEEIAVRAMKSGAKDYISKNDLSRLPAAIEREIADARSRLEAYRGEKALQISESRLRSIYENTSIGLAFGDLNGKFFDINPALYRILGYSLGELQDLGVPAISHPDDLLVDASHFKELLEGKCDRYQIEKRFYHKDGHVVWANAGISVVKDPAGKPLYCIAVIEDITQRKLTESVVKQNEEKFTKLFKSIPMPTYTWRQEGDDFVLIDYNNAAASFTDEAVKKVVGIKLSQMYAAYPQVLSDIKQCFQEKSVVERDMEYQFQFSDSLKLLHVKYAYVPPDYVLVHTEDFTERKRVEKALEESKERFKQIIENAGEGIYIIDSASRRILDSNKQASLMLGYTPEEILKLTSDDIEAHLNASEIQNRHAILSTQPLVRFESSHRRKDGSTFPVEINLTRLDPTSDKTLVSTVRDITERRKAEEILRESEQRYRFLFENMLNGCAYCHVSFEGGHPIDFKYLNVNKAFETHTGLKNVIGKNVSEVIPGIREADPGLLERYGRVALTGSPEHFEIFVESMKMWFTVSVFSPAREYFVSVFDDITERKHLEETQTFLSHCGLPGSGEDFFECLARYLAQSLAMEYVCIDRLEGDGLTAQTVAIYNNGTYEPNVSYALKDTPCGDVVGKAICCFPRDASRLFPKDAALQELKAESYIGTTLWSFDGKPIGLIAVIGQKPISNRSLAESVLKTVAIRAAGELERTQVEKEAVLLREKAEMSNRLVAIGEMAAGIAHEINNPLTGVIGFSELLMERGDLADDVKKELKIINDGSVRVKDIVKHLLTFARQTKPMKISTSINELVDGTLDLRSYVLRTSNINAVKNYQTDLPWITVDAGQMQQVFLNIIVNAEYEMKAAHGRGTLTITTAKVGDQIQISFKDDGRGMSPAILAKLFNPFFTTKGVGVGTGLGLSLSRSIILEHGGKIEVESEVGKGTTFIITLPITPDKNEAPIQTPVISSPSLEQLQHARILVVEDEHDIKNLVRAILTRNGHIVETTSDGREALSKIENNSYDILITDVRMPGLSGIELYNQIRVKHPEMTNKILFMSGDTSDSHTKAFFEQNNLKYISKPFDRETLIQKVNSILNP